MKYVYLLLLLIFHPAETKNPKASLDYGPEAQR
jgi:hypothetical protein